MVAPAMSAFPTRTQITVMLALSTPASLVAETLLRRALFTPDLRLLRGLLRPHLTPVAWALLAVTTAAALVGVPVQRRVHAWMFGRLGARATLPAARHQAELGAMYVASSVVQLPTLASTVTFTLGAELLPVATALGVAAVGVGAMGVFGARDAG